MKESGEIENIFSSNEKYFFQRKFLFFESDLVISFS